MDRRSYMKMFGAIPFFGLLGTDQKNGADSTGPTPTPSEESPSPQTDTVVEIVDIDGALERGMPTIKFALSNPSDDPVLEPVTVEIDGRGVVHEEKYTLPPKSIEILETMWYSRNNIGGRDLTAVVRASNDSDIERFHVNTRFYVDLISTRPIEDRDEGWVEVEYSVTNHGSGPDVQDVSLKTDQVPTESHEVFLSPDESETFVDEVKVWDEQFLLRIDTDTSSRIEIVNSSEETEY